jgi:hypothetical protein
LRFGVLALIGLGAACSSEPVVFPVVDAKYESCLVGELQKAGYKFQRVEDPAIKSEPPTAWPARTGAVIWYPSSKEEEQRVWCNVAFCYADTRDVRRGAFPDMCASYP